MGIRTSKYYSWPYEVCVSTHTIKEERLPAVRRGCGLRGRIVSLHAVRVAMATGQFAECQSANFFCVVASLPIECQSAVFESMMRVTLQTEPMIYLWLFRVLTISSLMLGTDGIVEIVELQSIGKRRYNRSSHTHTILLFVFIHFFLINKKTPFLVNTCDDP